MAGPEVMSGLALEDPVKWGFVSFPSGKSWAFLVAQRVNNLPAMEETQVRSLGHEDPLEEEMATHSNNLPGEFHGQRSLVGYSSWGHKESDTTG